MLGSSLGSVENGKFSAIERSSFGELMPDASCLLPDSFGSPLTTDNRLPTTDFWTGKPKIEGLGYAFLFRNYRADVGKWTTSDPLGYPDGWNNLAYVNNKVTACIDLFGLLEHYSQGYATPDAAGTAALTHVNYWSQKGNREVGGRVYYDKGKYYYTQPILAPGSASVSIGGVPEGTMDAGVYHTHPGPFPPSGSDRTLIQDYTVMFFSNDDGTISRLNGWTGQETVLEGNTLDIPKPTTQPDWVADIGQQIDRNVPSVYDDKGNVKPGLPE